MMNEPHQRESILSGFEQGHNRRDCDSKRKVLTLDTSRDYSGAVIEISLNGSEKWALLDSGANP